MRSAGTLLVALLVLLALPHSVLAASSLPYSGEVSDKTLEATETARKALLSDKAAMQNWTTEQWQAWADKRFTAETSPDGSTWRDWRKAQIKSKADHTVTMNWAASELNQPALNWDADDWKLFVDNVDYDYRSSDQYFCVILPSGQHRGQFLLGRWAYAMYKDDLPERKTWEKAISEEGSGSGITSEDLKLFNQLQQASAEMTAFLAGCICALILAVTWKW